VRSFDRLPLSTAYFIFLLAIPGTTEVVFIEPQPAHPVRSFDRLPLSTGQRVLSHPLEKAFISPNYSQQDAGGDGGADDAGHVRTHGMHE
jgi:hypothetical protein